MTSQDAEAGTLRQTSSGREHGDCRRSFPGLPGCRSRLPEIRLGLPFFFRELPALALPPSPPSGSRFSGCSPLFGGEYSPSSSVGDATVDDSSDSASAEQGGTLSAASVLGRGGFCSEGEEPDVDSTEVGFDSSGCRSSSRTSLEGGSRRDPSDSLGVSRRVSPACCSSGPEPASPRSGAGLAKGQRNFTRDHSSAITVVTRIDYSRTTASIWISRSTRSALPPLPAVMRCLLRSASAPAFSRSRPVSHQPSTNALSSAIASRRTWQRRGDLPRRHLAVAHKLQNAPARLGDGALPVRLM